MKEIESIWPFQELFVDPELAVETKRISATVNLKTAVNIKRESKTATITVEIFGSITEGKRQIANIRFANITKVKDPIRNTKRLKEKIVKKKLSELLSFLPDYLLKAGITVEKYINESEVLYEDLNAS
ncbi:MULTISPECIES: hypothetical protein [unclassified Desulfurobacterium]|uniref:hypothetical protein n=1 Tax=Desulfurobacterium sp. TC5-1 TaxID=1158318 RepID=UPI0003B472ED|nr:hypothetical protein [Desulfurobacterium sp. TC5-1]